MVNVPTSLNNLKIKVDDFHVGKLKTVPVDLRKFNTPKTQVNNLEKKIPDSTTLIDILVWWLQFLLRQKYVKLRTKLLIMINILLLLNLIS